MLLKHLRLAWFVLATARLYAFPLIEDVWQVGINVDGKVNVALIRKVETPQYPSAQGAAQPANIPSAALGGEYAVDLSSGVYFDDVSFEAAGRLDSPSAGESDAKISLKRAAFSLFTDTFDASLGKQKTIWGYGLFFYPAYPLELKSESADTAPVGSTPWSLVFNLPLPNQQINLFGYVQDESIEQGKLPKWGGASAVYTQYVNASELSVSGGALWGEGVQDRAHAGLETRIDLQYNTILTLSFGGTVTLARTPDFTPEAAVGLGFSSSEGPRPNMSVELAYNQGLYLGGLLSLTEFLPHLGTSLLYQLDFEHRGHQFVASLNWSPKDYFRAGLSVSYLEGEAESRFYSKGSPVIMEVHWTVSL